MLARAASRLLFRRFDPGHYTPPVRVRTRLGIRLDWKFATRLEFAAFLRAIPYEPYFTARITSRSESRHRRPLVAPQ